MKINVFTKPLYRWRYHPIKNIKYILQSFKCAYERITKGYCYRDLYDFSNYLAKLTHNGLLEFADSTYGYPDGMEFEEWQEYLRETAKLFYQSIEENEYYENQYWDDNKLEPTDKDKRFKRQAEISKLMEDDKNKAFDMLRDKFFHIWW